MKKIARVCLFHLMLVSFLSGLGAVTSIAHADVLMVNVGDWGKGGGH